MVKQIGDFITRYSIISLLENKIYSFSLIFGMIEGFCLAVTVDSLKRGFTLLFLHGILVIYCNALWFGRTTEQVFNCVEYQNDSCKF